MQPEAERFLIIILAAALLLAPNRSLCLKMVQVRVPAYKLKGETAVLECLYELEGFEKLYTVKWYKENEEFYRFVPKYKPSQISYRVEGIRIDHQQSNDTRVTLKTVSLKTTANYRCEVSAEAPSFASAQGSGRLEVVVRLFLNHALPGHALPSQALPQSGSSLITLFLVTLFLVRLFLSQALPQSGSSLITLFLVMLFLIRLFLILPTNGPHITGEKNQYMVGDEIDLTCTSGKSYPPSELKWLVNDQEVTSQNHLVVHPPVVHPHGLVTTSLGLRLPATPHHFHGGNMKLRCVACVSPVLWQGDMESVVETPLLVNREAMLLEAVLPPLYYPLPSCTSSIGSLSTSWKHSASKITRNLGQNVAQGVNPEARTCQKQEIARDRKLPQAGTYHKP
ncbi:hypothetical protein J6590_080055 [Homalodisca vitripennis]|nr:hypothetical protein J6590_080055 [Homalodisca vitripennis]